MLPKLSVIMTAYNTSKFIADSVNAILNQTFQDFEILVVNDASTDGTLDVLKGIKDKRITIYDNPVNSGTYFSRNVGVYHAKGEFLAFVDSDDITSPFRFEKMLNHFDEQPDLMFQETRYLRFWDNNQELWYRNWTRGIGFPMIRRKVVKDLGFFLPVRSDGDVEYALRAEIFYGKDKCKLLNDFTYWAVQRGDNLTTTITGRGPERMQLRKFYSNGFHKTENLRVDFPFTDSLISGFRHLDIFALTEEASLDKVVTIASNAENLGLNDELLKGAARVLKFSEEANKMLFTKLQEQVSKNKVLEKKLKQARKKLHKIPKPLRNLIFKLRGVKKWT